MDEKLKIIAPEDEPSDFLNPPPPAGTEEGQPAELTGWHATATSLKPTEVPKEIFKAPDSELNLEWIYGYSAQEARSNLRYTPSGDIVYHSSCVGVVYRKVRHRRRCTFEGQKTKSLGPQVF